MMGRPMEYPTEFISRVQNALPGDDEIVELMATGSAFSVENKLRQAGKEELAEEWDRIFQSRPQPSVLEEFFS